ncbi:MarR family transcriptional regulator [Leptospira weilii]|uniref:MarR family transcriptional regulator n=1 Tax=Leptospira weilii TaxID=28184 RepID=UPI0006890FDB|nr:MarR family transcriptional regulator [Leptospira weilii]
MKKINLKNPLSKDPGYLLWQTSLDWQKKAKVKLDKFNLTLTQYYILYAIRKIKTEVKQVDIANFLNIDRMMTSKIISSLKEKAIVSVINERYVSLNSIGTRLLKEAEQEYLISLNDYFGMSSAAKSKHIEYYSNLNMRNVESDVNNSVGIY